MKRAISFLRHAPVIVMFVIGLLCARPAAAGSLTLLWDFNDEPDVTGYIVYVGTQSGSYSQSFDVGNANAFVYESAASGQRYYFAVAAYAGFLLSDLSLEVSGETTGSSNAIPYLFSPGNQATTIGQGVSLQLVGGDPLDEPVMYGASGLPAGLGLGAGSGLISGTTTTPGSYPVSISVSDGVLASQISFTWTVLQPGVSAPVPSPPNPGSSNNTDTDNPEDDLTRALRVRASGQTYTGTAALVRTSPVAQGGTSDAPAARAYSGTASIARPTSLGSSLAPVEAIRSDTGRSATTRSVAVTPVADEAGMPAVYTGRAAAARPVSGEVSQEAPPAYTGTTAMSKGSQEEAAPAVSGSRAVTRALTTSSPAGGSQAMITSGSAGASMGGESTAMATGRTSSVSTPMVSIQTPLNQAAISGGAPVVFAAIAQDAQDGNLTSQVVWSSSIEGHIGSGGTLSKVLTSGVHMITAAVTDSSGATRISRVSVVVGN